MEQLQQLVSVAEQALDGRTGAARISLGQVAQNEQLESAAAKGSAAPIDTEAAFARSEVRLLFVQNRSQRMLREPL